MENALVSPEVDISPNQKISQRPNIQILVEKEFGRLKTKNAEGDSNLLYAHARDRVAARFNRERLKTALQEAENKAIKDPLTGMLNAAGFNERLQVEAKTAKRLQQSIVIALLDANYLKQINDLHGHQAGDEYLKKIANVLDASSRSADAIALVRETSETENGNGPVNLNVARWGGDEFGVLLLDTDIDGAQKWWERTSEKFQSQGISIGVGIQVVTAEELQNAKGSMGELLKQKKHEADTALYDAKAKSKKTNTPSLTVYNSSLQRPDEV